MRLARIILVVGILAAAVVALWHPRPDGVLGSYATSLHGRTRGQRMNATRAARALDGLVIEAGANFSFNKTVGSWTADRGYVLAPVSYDGELVVDWGGGVCQTSSTLYNAALIGGLRILERHRHTWAPKYVPSGQDAAVAQQTIDLRLRNPYPYPVRLQAVVDDNSVGFRIIGKARGPMARVEHLPLAAEMPTKVIRMDPNLPAGRRRTLTRPRPGEHVAIYRVFPDGRREFISMDAYPAMNQVVAVGTRSLTSQAR